VLFGATSCGKGSESRSQAIWKLGDTLSVDLLNALLAHIVVPEDLYDMAMELGKGYISTRYPDALPYSRMACASSMNLIASRCE